MTRPAEQIAAEIDFEWQAFLDSDLAGDMTHAAEHYQRMDELLEERGHIPCQRPAK